MLPSARLKLLLAATVVSVAAAVMGNWLFDTSPILFVLFSLVSACTGFSHGLFSQAKRLFETQAAQLICLFCAIVNMADLFVLFWDLVQLGQPVLAIVIGLPIYLVTAWHAQR